MTIGFRLPPRGRSRIAGAALALAWFAALVTALSALLLRTHAVDAAAGFAAFAAGLCLAALAALAALLAMVVVWRSGRRGGVRAAFALALAGLVLAGPVYTAAMGFKGRATDDVVTDLADPPRFDRAPKRDPGDAPPPGLAIAPEQAARQRAAYPDLAPLRLALSPEDVSALAIELVEARGWRLLGPTSYPRGGPPTGRIEAIAPTPVLALRDAVSIRIREDGDGARVDMRSVSRLPGVDFGANAARIKSFLADLSAAADAAP